MEKVADRRSRIQQASESFHLLRFMRATPIVTPLPVASRPLSSMTKARPDRPNTIPEDEPLKNSHLSVDTVSSAMPLLASVTTTKNDGADDMLVRSQRSWIVKVGPVKKHMFRGRLIPNVHAFGFGSKRRKITVQVQVPRTPTSGGGGGSLSFLFGKKEGETAQDKKNTERDGFMESLGEHDVVWFKVFKKPTANGDDEASVATDVGADISIDGETSLFATADEAEYCVEANTFELSDVEILNKKGKSLECRIGTGNETVIRDLKFRTVKEAESFARVYAKMFSMAADRTQRQLAKFRETETPVQSVVQDMELKVAEPGATSDKGIAILCEIVSAQNLPIADVYSSDPYVIVRMGTKEIHRTSIISKDRDPIWTVQTGSLFLLQMTPEEFFSFPSMSFVIKDFDQFGSNEILGTVYVSLKDILAGNGERREYQIVPHKTYKTSKNEDLKPKLFLRFRPASKDDITFMKHFVEDKKAVGAYVNETYLPLRAPEMTLTKRLQKRGENKEILHRVRPCPDPDRVDETKWMTKEQIFDDSMKTSKNWIEAGSGGRERLGRVYLEVLGCENLPNMDNLTLDVRDATDAFACIVYEDAVVNTDVIANTLSPRWPSWSQRAFVFNVAHPASDILLAIFDFDPECSPLQMVARAASSLHDPVGRVQVNLSAFHMNTEYTLCYPLYYGESAEDMMKPNGRVWIRLRKEWVDVHRALIAAALPPNPPVFVTVARAVDFQVAHYTTEGAHVETDFSLSTFTQYIQELQSYKELHETIFGALMTVWLWRGHFPVTIMGRTILLPLHSITAYVWAIIVTRNFNTFPSFLLFSIGWLLLATNEHVNKSPNVWERTPHFLDGVRLLLNTKLIEPQINIDPNYNKAALEAYNKSKEDAVTRRKHEKELELKYDIETRKRFGVLIDDATAEDEDFMSSARTNLFKKIKEVINPMTLTVKPVLHPIQLKLRTLVIGLRIIKSIVLWDDFYYAFWLTLACFAASMLLMWVPWGWTLRWLFRAVAWIGLGPWMMLVDWKYIAENPDLTDEQRDELIRKRVEERYEAVIEAAAEYQMRKERIIKLRSMSTYMFGRFHLRVPHFNEELFSVSPLPQSFARPYDASSAPPVHIVDRKYGQRLEGDMIPMRDIQIANKKKVKAWRRNKMLLPGRAGVALDRFRRGKGKKPLAERVMDRIAEGEEFVAEHVPLLGGHTEGEKKAYDAAATARGDDATPATST